MIRTLVSLVVLVASCSLSFSQALPYSQLQVRLVDCRSAMVVSGRRLELYLSLSDAASHWDSRGASFRARPFARAKTRHGGVAKFQLTVPFPKMLWVVDGDYSQATAINTDEAARVGLVANDQTTVCSVKPKLLYSLPPRAGEVIYFTERFGFWEKLEGWITP